MKSNFYSKAILVSLVFFLSFFAANARNYYVSSSYTGSVSNGGFTTPWKSLANVQSNLGSIVPGDFVLFAKGDKFSGTLSLQSKSNVYFGVYGTGADPLFWGTGSTVGVLITLNNCTNITFYGWNISDTTISFTDRYIEAKIQTVFQFENTSTNNVIRKCTMDRIGYGAYFTTAAGSNTIDSSDIGNLRMIRNTPGGNDDFGGVPVQLSSSNNTITNNYFHDCYAASYDYNFDGGGIEFFEEGVVIENNVIAYNTFISSNGIFEFGSSADGIANNLIQNNKIYYNKFINNNTIVFINNNSEYRTKVTNLQFYNNVIIQTLPNSNPSGSSGIQFSMMIGDATAGILVLKNNIFQVTNGSPITRSGQFTVSNLPHTNNIFKLSNGSITNFTLGSTEVATSGTIWVNTSDANPLNWDLHPTTNSLLINFGQNIGLTQDYDGTPISGLPDAGVYEFVSSTPVSNPLAASLTSTSIACNGGTSTIVVSATGGTAPYVGTGTYTVNAGTFSYIVSDARGLRDTVNVTINQPTLITATVTAGTIAITGGSTTASVSNVTGGTGNTYTYSLDGGAFQSSNTFSGVLAGSHAIIIKDINGCIISKSFFINAPVVSTLTANAVAGLISCNGGTTTVTVSAAGGTAPYTGTGAFTVSAGTYTYNVTDANGVVDAVSVTVSEPTALSLSLTSGTITSTGGTTSITATATGGTIGYRYKLNNGTYQSSNVFSTVAAGTHTVTVKDANGCTKSGTISIAQPSSLLTATATAGTIACNGGSTTVTVSAAGGTAPYTGTGTFTESAGTYSYNVTDANGVIDVVSVTVSQPTSISLSLTSGTITSTGGTTSITATSTGGTAAYSYKLNSGSYQSSNVFLTVAAGTHIVTVKDANGCTKSGTISIAQPSSLLTATATAGTIACNGGTTTIIVSAAGGTAPYTGTGTFTVSAGTYSYNVTDANGVIDAVSVTVSQPTAISLSLTSGTITSTGGTTSITATSTGGTAAYSYKLNSGSYQSSNVFSTVAAGTYTVTVKDANGCTKSGTISISQPSSLLNATATAGTIACNGGTTTVTVSAAGGTAPYSGTGSFTVTAGTYTYNVTDANGGIDAVSVTVSQPTAISLSLTSGTISSTGGTTSITATANGGTATYTYKLNSGNYQSSNVFSTVASGTHTVTVKDVNGCAKLETISISQPSSLLNATATAGIISCNGGNTTIEVLAAGGTAPYTGTGTFTVTAGTYTYNVTDANGVVDVVSVTVSQPTAIVVELSSGSITSANGTTFISANVTGGSAPYSYTLNNGTYQTTNSFNNVSAGTHQVTVKDSKGCVANRTITIADFNIDTLVASVSAGTISCNGGTAIVNVTATGGVAPYIGVGSYTMSAGVNTISVIDAVGTIKTIDITLTQPSEINVVVIVRNAEVVSGGKTSIKITATGGTGTYRYSLDGGAFQTTNSYRGIGAGTHMVSVVDQNGCVKMVSFIVTEINATVGLSISLISRSNVTCIGANNGSITIGAAGGRAPYSYTLNGINYNTDGKFTNLAPGTYRATVKDFNGNIAELEVTILDGKKRCGTYTNSLSFNVYPNPSVSSFKADISTEEVGEITLQVFDVLGKMIHQEKGQSDKLYNFGYNFKAGVYIVKVTQANKCTTTKIIKQ